MTDVLVCVVVVVGDDTWQGSSLRVVHVCVCVCVRACTVSLF